MDVQVSFTKGSEDFDVGRSLMIEDFRDVSARVAVVNDSNASAPFPCAFLQAQGVWNTYQFADVADAVPYSIPLNPAAFELRSDIRQLAPGEACVVTAVVDTDVLAQLVGASGQRSVRILVRYIVPQDDAFGTVSGRGMDVVLTVTTS